MVAVVVERTATGFGRCRLGVIPTASSASLRRFLIENVEPGSHVFTDGWPSYPGATVGLFAHTSNVAPGPLAVVYLPAVHRVASLLKRWILGTHQGSVSRSRLPLYLNEFVFRFNRRASHSRGLVFYRLLSLAVLHEQVTYVTLLSHRRPGPVHPPTPSPGLNRGRTPALHRPAASRPWGGV
jgi:transposase-like protein